MAEEHRPPPQSTVQAAGQAATDVIGGLKQSPALLAVVVLNVVMLGAQFWNQNSINEAVRANRDQLLAMVSKCLNHQQQGKFVPGIGLGREGRKT